LFKSTGSTAPTFSYRQPVPKNTAGSVPSGGDTSQDEAEGSSFSAALEGKIQVSADVSREEIATAERAFRDAGADDVLTR
jgi:hypothetical protein